MTRHSLSVERETWCPMSMSQSGCGGRETCREHEEAVIEEEGGAICGALTGFRALSQMFSLVIMFKPHNNSAVYLILWKK